MRYKTKTINEKDYKKLCRELNTYGFKTYKEFLESTLWSEFKKRIPKGKGICKVCRKNKANLPHHITYKKFLVPSNIVWICSSCHTKIHKDILETEKSISFITDKLTNENKHKGIKKEMIRKVKKIRDYQINKSTCWCSLAAFNGCVRGSSINDVEWFAYDWGMRPLSQKYVNIFNDNKEYFYKKIQELINNRI